MKMKVWLTLLLALTLVFSLTACGSGTNSSANSTNASNASNGSDQTGAANQDNTLPSDDQEEIQPEDGASLTVWGDPTERDFVLKVIDGFKEKYNIPVKFQEVQPQDVLNNMTNDGPAGVGGDVFALPHDQLGGAVVAGLVLPNDTFGDVTAEENSDAAVKATMIDNVLYGYPKSVETYALFYNKDLVSDPPKTWDDVIKIAQSINDIPNKKFGFMMEVNKIYYGYAFLASHGGYVFGNEGTDSADIGLNNDGAVEGLKTFAKLRSILPLKSADITDDIKTGMFTSGKLALDVNGPWRVGDYLKANINFGVVPFPTMDGTPTSSFSGVKAWYVSAFTKYPNASKLFARFADLKENQLLNNKMTGAIPANKEAGDDPQIKDDPLISGFYQQFQHSHAMPSIPEMGTVWGPGDAMMTDIWDNGTDPKVAADKAVQQIKEALKASSSN